jgi:hypothetical protein
MPALSFSIRRQGMPQVLKRLTQSSEHKSIYSEVEGCVTAVDCAVVVWANEHEVAEIIIAASA